MAAIGTRQPIGIQLMDYAEKKQSIINLYSGEITAVSLAGFLSDLSDLETAIDAVVLGVRSKGSWGSTTVVTNTPPTDENARVETELLVYLRGATTEAPFSFRIPTVDYAAFNYSNVPAADTVIISGGGASAATTALVAAIEAIARTPWDDAELVEVIGMRVVR